MPRDFGQIDSSVWREDEDWRALPADAQWLYMLFISQTDLSAAGVLNLAITRWQRMCADMTAERFTEAMATLEGQRYIFSDYDMEELLVRTFARKRTQWANGKRRKAVGSAISAIHSTRLRRALAVDLSKLSLIDELMAAIAVDITGLPVVTPQMMAEFSPEGTPERLAELWTEPSGNASTNGSPARACQTPDAIRQTPDANTDTTAPRSAAPASTTRRGTRIPDDFAVNDEMRKWAHERGWTDPDINAATEEFVDYWQALPGTRATKLDWIKTWRNRLRDMERYRGRRTPSPGGDRFAGHLSLIESLPHEEGA